MKENNILLANFLGLELQEDNYNESCDYINPEDLKFHDYWNWLMEVVKKIETLETKDGRTFTIDFHKDSVLIFEYGTHTNEVVFTEGKGRLENLYNACVEFVEWWNKNN